MDGVQSIPVLIDSESFRKDTVSNRHHNSWLLRIKLPYVVEGRASMATFSCILNSPPLPFNVMVITDWVLSTSFMSSLGLLPSVVTIPTM